MGPGEASSGLFYWGAFFINLENRVGQMSHIGCKNPYDSFDL